MAKREHENSTVVHWGWIGRAVAGVIVTGIPAMIVTEMIRDARTEHRLTMMEQTAAHQVQVSQEIMRWIRAHDDWGRGKTGEINGRLASSEARLDVLEDRAVGSRPRREWWQNKPQTKKEAP